MGRELGRNSDGLLPSFRFILISFEGPCRWSALAEFRRHAKACWAVSRGFSTRPRHESTRAASRDPVAVL